MKAASSYRALPYDHNGRQKADRPAAIANQMKAETLSARTEMVIPESHEINPVN